ncbi:MAG: hypothetical protein K2L69_03320 [Muribaculaceae bacterium]|nr:hypothetical protein [Muribaculaceae bacterium]
MKKLLLLTALFTTLFIGFTACSDNEPEVELDADDWSTPFGIGFSSYTITDIIGELAYVKGKDAYQFLPDKSYNEIDSLMWMSKYKLRFDSSYTDSIKDIISQVGSKVILNATVDHYVGSNIADVYDFKIGKFNSSRSGWCGTEM